ncbi:MAG TPA: flagellar hook-associated protein FlgK [Sphingobium sp.]|uniref:flagellar hook-associated protein FlgK n=1 Tax=Sphingobium sp. TaxID=1912891 RepID=UPI002ED2F4D0
MAISDLLSIGASGARAYRAAMGAVSENISNATTVGYNRRTVSLGESPSSSASSAMYKPGVAFGGVEVVAIVRQTDSYLDLAARNAAATFKDADKRATWLDNVQTALDDGSLGVGQKLTTMFAAAEKLAANPTDTTLRTNLLFSVEQVNTSFKQTASDLSNVQNGIVSDANNEVVAVNDALSRLASTNEALGRAIPGSSNAAQLMDQRDQALSDISSRLNVTVTFNQGGTADVTYDGIKLVDNITSKAVAVTANSDKTLAFSVDGTTIATPTSGSLSGIASSATVARDRLQSVNDLATQYVSDLNTWHSGGTTDAGAAGGDLVTWTPGDISTLQVAITDTADIAVNKGGASNGNLTAITTIRGTSGVENGWSALIAVHANLLNATNAEQASASARNDQAQSARADVSGVDLDREAADLMRLQQAYSACARVIQTGKDTLDAILQIA